MGGAAGAGLLLRERLLIKATFAWTSEAVEFFRLDRSSSDDRDGEVIGLC